MDLSAINPTLLVASLMVASTPILLASIGELVVEKSGVLNLGVEGMMIIGAICGFAAAVLTGSPMFGFLCSIWRCGCISNLCSSDTIFSIQSGSYRTGTYTVWALPVGYAWSKLCRY